MIIYTRDTFDHTKTTQTCSQLEQHNCDQQKVTHGIVTLFESKVILIKGIADNRFYNGWTNLLNQTEQFSNLRYNNWTKVFANKNFNASLKGSISTITVVDASWI